MSQESVALAGVFLIVFAGLLLYFTIRAKTGRRPTLRRIRGFDLLQQLMGQAVESGRKMHLAVGVGGIANETTADSLAGISVLQYVNEQAAKTGSPAIVSMADPALMLLAQNTIRPAYRHNPEAAETAYRHVRWIAPQPAAYAAGVMNILDSGEAGANVMVGRFGDEYLLMGETAARRNLPHIGGASDPNTLPFIYASAQETLLGEEIYAAGAYLQKLPAHFASLLAQDTIRWLVGWVILGGILVATFNLWWLWIVAAILALAILVSMLTTSLR